MSARCVVVAPHERVAQVAKHVCAGDDLPYKVVSCDADTIGVEMAKKYCAAGALAIVSGGGMAKAIAEEISRPVISIETSFMDLLDALAKAKPLGDKIGLVLNSPLHYDMDKVRSLLDLRVEKIDVPRDGGLADAIGRAKEAGIDVIVGGATPVYFAEAAGMKAIHLESGAESIRDAFRRAEELIRLEEARHRRDGFLRRMLDFAREGILVTNARNEVSYLNRSGERMLSVDRDHVVGRECASVFPFLPIREAADLSPGRAGGWCENRGSLLFQNAAACGSGAEDGGAVSMLYTPQLLDSLKADEQRELHLKGHVAHYTFDRIITRNPGMRRLINQARLFSQSDSAILVTGESGSGKEVFAQSIHNAGARKNRPFVAINCASISDDILEGELFGREAGARAGKEGKKGCFEMAEGGTLFLDEIGEISQNLQSKLLRALRRREIVRVGGDRAVPVNVRIIAATMADIGAEVRAGRFRRDLYYRLNTLWLSIPPLRERMEDLPLLAGELAAKISNRLGLRPLHLDDGLVQKFRSYPWLGNIRELANALERLTIIHREKAINEENIDAVLADMRHESGGGEEPLSLAEIEKKAIMDALQKNNWDRTKTCKQLGISSATLWRRLKEWDVQND